MSRKSAIACLARTRTEYPTLISMATSVSKHIYNKDVYDFIIFHEDSMLPEQRVIIQQGVPEMPIKFINVQKDFEPAPIPQRGRWSWCHDLSLVWGIGYRHMCKFWFDGFLKYVNDYKYVIRIDDDCIIKEFPRDMLLDMEKKNIHYITPWMDDDFREYPPVYIGLEECLSTFCRESGREGRIITKGSPYTNISLIDIEYFKNLDLFKKWCDIVDSDNGIYVSRWGDNWLWGLFLKNFLSSEEWAEDKRIKYYHGSHDRMVN